MAGSPLPDFPGQASTVVPWQSETIKPLVDELIEACESNRLENFLAKCVEHKLAPKLVKEIEADIRFPKLSKAMLKRSLPRLITKYLNKAGVSAEFQDELECVSAVVMIISHNSKMDAKLEEHFAKFAEQQAAKAKA